MQPQITSIQPVFSRPPRWGSINIVQVNIYGKPAMFLRPMLIVYLYPHHFNMEEKISAKAIDQYSNFFASKLADVFFQRKEKINGQEILSLSEIKQVNLLVVKELMRLWNAEQQKWQSPFFNYEAEAV